MNPNFVNTRVVHSRAEVEARLTELDNEKSKIAKEVANLRYRLACLSENNVIKEPTVLFGSSVTKDSPPEKEFGVGARLVGSLIGKWAFFHSSYFFQFESLLGKPFRFIEVLALHVVKPC
ncbi:MAG: hypothetical protein JRJ79_15455 [Deltaproteobacteria bacterium]|nr:hypothetical protein [Deltaproteobacteria bacterium]